ncbi:MarR family winged helix-turn-helix transcriptional regulator [Mangrovihabitans endophyticus]|uniref:MarR family winged helix-turn-helix transcriptional regulator n=1 Tax=Mangrovihabitans endophyticus TaxID=1751298 RepID=UPI00166BCC2C|nr:MarR family transcriptional regulator [Mangrovihabitans endophyticus]
MTRLADTSAGPPSPDAGPRLDIGPDDHLTYVMAKAEHLLERRLDAALARHGLTLRQFSALAHIGRTPGLSGADLARLLLTSPQAVNTLVQRMLSAGLIQRADGPQRQPRALTLSEAGLTALKAAAATATQTERAALSAIEPDDLRAVHRALQGLTAALGDG